MYDGLLAKVIERFCSFILTS